jgi:hypothetical protein
MDLPTFVAMLATECLWFSKAAQFKDDPWEGFCRVQTRNATAGDEVKWITRESGDKTRTLSVSQWFASLSQLAADYLENAREHLYVNSWCLADESLPMWDLHGDAGRGIAVSSSVGRYARAVKLGEIRLEQYAFGKVKYDPDLESCADLLISGRDGFHSATPAQILDITEIPTECGLVEAGVATADERKRLIRAAGWVFQLRSRHAALLHDHRSGTVARHAGPHLATGRRHAAESTTGTGGEAASAASPGTLHICLGSDRHAGRFRTGIPTRAGWAFCGQVI